MSADDSQARATISKEIEQYSSEIEKKTLEQLKKAKEEQEIVIQKINELADSLEKIESVLPPSNLQETTDRINKLCSRIEFCRVRINRVNKRAEIMLSTLSKPKTSQKGGKLIELV